MCLTEKVRVSIGSAILLELTKGKLDARLTTIYMLTYRPEKCSANCGFCPQAKNGKSRTDLLSRVTWPSFSMELVIAKVERASKKGAVKRICIQTLNYPEVFDDVLDLAKKITSNAKVPLSISCQPLDKEQMQKLVEVGVDRISIPLDAATAELFDMVKGISVGGPYRWEKQRRALADAVEIFGKDHVTTHLIVGLGETEREIIETLQWCVDSSIFPSLFAFTPVPGTALEGRPQPSINTYRRVQIARHLIVQGIMRSKGMIFDKNGCLINFGISEEEIQQIVNTGVPFVTSGCPGCNRPFYNEKPSGPIYNYPQNPLPKEINRIKEQIRSTYIDIHREPSSIGTDLIPKEQRQR